MADLTLTRIRTDRPIPRDNQQVHATIAASSTGGRVMWAAPCADLLIVQAERCDLPYPGQSTTGPVRTHYPAGTPVQVSLIGNPVVSEFTRGQRGRRRPLPLDQHEAWLRRKLDGAVDLDEVAVQPIGSRSGRRGDGRVLHRLAGFYAAGTVTDSGALAGLIRSGVGPGKAYGAGLLLVSEVTR